MKRGKSTSSTARKTRVPRTKTGGKIRAAAIREGYRSGLEQDVATQIKSKKLEVKYEDTESVILYTKPESNHRYTPDFVLPNGIIIETKGLFSTADRKKHLLVKEQHPELDIRFVFTNPKAKIWKGSKTSYADWCAKHGFLFSKGLIPDEWFEEVKHGT